MTNNQTDDRRTQALQALIDDDAPAARELLAGLTPNELQEVAAAAQNLMNLCRLLTFDQFPWTA